MRNRELAARIDQVATELREFRASTEQRLDGLHQRIDTVVDSLADLRRDFATHTHDG